VVVVEGESAELACRTKGTPEPLVLWQKEDNLTMPSGKVEEVVQVR